MQIKLLQIPKVRLSTTQRLLIISSVSIMAIVISAGAFLWFNGISKSSKANVTLSSFVATYTSPSVQVQWLTEDETDNAFFSLERSANAQDYETIYEAPGNGNSQSQNIYSYTDNAPMSGVSYYRLKQTDIDGTVNYSAIQSVNNESPIDNGYGISANPVTHDMSLAAGTQSTTQVMSNNNQFTNVSVFSSNATNRISISLTAETDANTNISVVDISGNILKTLSVPLSQGNNQTQMDIGFLPAGIYFLTFLDNAGHHYTQKFVRSN